MPKKSMETNPFSGRWHIVSMAVWSPSAINAERQGFVSGRPKPASDGRVKTSHF
jgi:hypothetical protein